jgi:peroxiredoxin
MTTALGDELRLGDARGNVVVVAFVPSWCRVSQAVAVAMRQLREGHPDDDLVVLGVDEGDRPTLETRIGPRPFTSIPIAFDARGTAARTFELRSIPSIVVLDREGIVRFVHEGFHGDRDVDALLREVYLLLGELPAQEYDDAGPAIPADGR